MWVPATPTDPIPKSHMILRRLVLLLSVSALAACMPMPPAGHIGGTTVPVSRQARPDAPKLKKLQNGHYRVRKPWTVTLNGRVWKVQKGYSSNGITAPAKVKASLGDGIDRPETWAAVFHDWLFTQPGISRTTADKTFYELLLAYGVPEKKARMMYTTVSVYSLTKGSR